MKLYARIENEKGKVDGMGGNEQLMIEVTGGNQLIARIRFNQIDAMKYHLDVFPVAYPDLLAVDVKGHGYKVTRKD